MSDIAAAQQDAAFEFFATCAAGFEQLLAGELSSLGITSSRPLKGQVAFTGTLRDAYKACMWSRMASRVVLVLLHGDATDSDELYATLKELAWEEHLPLDATFAIDAHGTNDNLRNTQFVALRAKDAICDRIQDMLGGRPNVDTKNPHLRVVVRLRNSRVTCGIDLSGAPLFRRGGAAHASDGLGGMRPDYAAAFLAAAGWHTYWRNGKSVLVDLYSGSGVLAAEAMSAALGYAPGLGRARWGFERWLGHDKDAWQEILSEAQAKAEAGRAREDSVKLIAFDNRRGASLALTQALRAGGVFVKPTFIASTDALSDALASCGEANQNTLSTLDLSWLTKESEAQEAAVLGVVGNILGSFSEPCKLAVFGQNTLLAKAYGLKAEASYEVKLGRDESSICLYDTGAQEGGALTTLTLKTGQRVPVLVSASDQFAARLAKVAKLRAKWARKEDISCYRVYDADLPDYAVAIDIYHASETSRRRDAGKTWLIIQEYEAPKSVDADLAHSRLLDVLALAPVILNVAPENVFVRVRRHAKGGSQYADGGRAQNQASSQNTREGAGSRGAKGDAGLKLPYDAHLIDEGGLVFEVNFNDRLDTGIFLDHRDVRAEVREMAKKTKGSKRFLNLFAYTGTATCYAADGGAKYTTTVDLSSTYLDWARRNMSYNGFEGPEHEFVRQDVVRWISEQRHTANRWDLVFCDPPTFSNSKRMSKATFDVQRDHAELLIGISRLLTRDGVCLFSCNLRGFKPDTEKLAKAGVQIEDVTQGSIPEDFSRNAKIHHCYLVRRTPREMA